jgi:uncharacterized membrane protein YdbT with pleckstrin-like domain
MSYIEENLLPSEEVQYRAKLHWIIHLSWIAWAILALALAITALTYRNTPTLSNTLFGGAAICLLLAIVTGIPSWIRASTSEFAVTNRRVLVKVGFIKRRTLELMLNKVELIGVDQTIWGRLFNYGTITITGTGGTHEPFTNISHPLEFRHNVQAHIPV